MSQLTRLHVSGPARYFDVDTLAEYAACPMRYKLRYVDGIKEDKISHDDEVIRQLKAIAYKHGAEEVVIDFAKQLAKGVAISRRDFRNQLGQKWYPYMSFRDFLFAPLTPGERLTTKSIEFMDRVYSSLAGISGIIVGATMPFTAILAKDLVSYEDGRTPMALGVYGSLPMLARTSAGAYTIVVFADDVYPAWSTPVQAISVDYRTQAMSFAFRSTYRILETKVHIIDFARLQTYDVQCDRRHYMRLQSLIKHMAFAEAEGYPPMPSLRCDNCGYKPVCMA